MEDKMWLFKSYSDESDIEAVKKVIERGTWWVKGSEIEEFEEKVSDLANREYGIAFNSGTSALHANLLAYGFDEGEVIVPSFTFAATANSVVAAGAKPVFADIEKDSLGLDPEDVRKKISVRTKAIMPIHFAGDVCKGIQDLKTIANEHDIPLIEDAAHSIGAKMENSPVGSFGHSAEFSFCFNKIITTGEGGMIVTDSEEHMRRLELIRSHGRNKDKEYVTYGLNLRMSSMAAALGGSQVDKLDFLIKRRREMASYLNKKLDSIPELILPLPREDVLPVYQLYNLRFKEENVQKQLKKYLADKGIPSRVTYNPVHLTPYYQNEWGWSVGDLSVTEDVSNKILTLPFHPDLKKEDLDYMSETINDFSLFES